MLSAQSDRRRDSEQNKVARINDAPKPTTLNSTYRKATATKTRVRSVVTGQVRVWKYGRYLRASNHHTGACNLRSCTQQPTQVEPFPKRYASFIIYSLTTLKLNSPPPIQNPQKLNLCYESHVECVIEKWRIFLSFYPADPTGTCNLYQLWPAGRPQDSRCLLKVNLMICSL